MTAPVRKGIGWAPGTDIGAGLRRTIAWYTARWTTEQHCRIPTALGDDAGERAEPPRYFPGHEIQRLA